MKIIISSVLLITIWWSAAILAAPQQHHEIDEKQDGHHHHHPHHEPPPKAISYQSIELEHFHAVPTYVKKEDVHLLKHPVHKGKTSADVKVHHGHKHDPGHAIATIHSSVHEVKYEPIEYKHEAVHHSVHEQQSPPHHHYHPVHGQSEEAGAEYTQAHAAIALVDGSQHGGRAEEEYKSSYGHHYHQQQQSQARAAAEESERVQETQETQAPNILAKINNRRA